MAMESYHSPFGKSYIFKWSIVLCYVRLPECKTLRPNGDSCRESVNKSNWINPSVPATLPRAWTWNITLLYRWTNLFEGPFFFEFHDSRRFWARYKLEHSNTPPKTNIEPENIRLEKEKHLQYMQPAVLRFHVNFPVCTLPETKRGLEDDFPIGKASFSGAMLVSGRVTGITIFCFQKFHPSQFTKVQVTHHSSSRLLKVSSGSSKAGISRDFASLKDTTPKKTLPKKWWKSCFLIWHESYESRTRLSWPIISTFVFLKEYPFVPQIQDWLKTY